MQPPTASSNHCHQTKVRYHSELDCADGVGLQLALLCVADVVTAVLTLPEATSLIPSKLITADVMAAVRVSVLRTLCVDECTPHELEAVVMIASTSTEPSERISSMSLVPTPSMALAISCLTALLNEASRAALLFSDW
jgi:hypothetical protein